MLILYLSLREGQTYNVVIIAKRIHLFPYRTQKLSSLAAMVLGGQPPGRVARSHVEPIGQAVKTPPFHGGNRGSIPLWVTNIPGV